MTDKAQSLWEWEGLNQGKGVVTRMRSARHADSLRYVCMYGSTWEVVYINDYLIKTPAMILPMNITVAILYTCT